ncbi:hypothetical protein MSG28_001976, partial [Choristoneura fumiferana]
IENDFDRRRQAAVGHPGFNEHQTRFGLNSPLQNFQQQGSLVSSPAPAVQFQQSLFQQPYVPQFNNLLPTQNIPNNAGSLPLGNNGFFNQQNIPLQNNFQQQGLGQIPQNNLLPQAPTLATFQNGIPFQQSTGLSNNPNIQGTVNIGQQRPTQAAFLPTLPTTPNQAQFQQSPITIQQAPNLAPQNVNLNNGQIPFQSSLGQAPIFPNGQASQIQNYFEQQSQENLEKLKELQERQRIIQKHQEFVQKQQQKQQEKVKELHEEFISKQATKTLPTFSTTERYEDFYNRNQEKRRPLLAHETDLFRKAVQMYEKQHPTTTTTAIPTTTTTTPAPTPKYKTRPKYTPTRTRAPPQDKQKQKLYNEIKTLLEESENKGFDDNLRAKSVALLQKPDILKQLRVALAENPEDFNEKNFTSREISLNGQKFEVIRTTNPNLIPKGAITADGSNLQIMGSSETQKESRINFDDLTKGVLPPGADFELIRQSDNGKLEEVSKIPSTIQNKKKVTFVFLEEQDDGSYKVKGVKANGQQTEEGPEVESILNKIKKGEIQLPGGPAKISNGLFSSTSSPTTDATDYIAESSHHPSSYSSFVTTSNHGSSGHTNPIVHTTPSTYRSTSTPTTRNTQPQTYTSSPTTRSVSTTERYFSKSTPQPDFSTSRNVFNPSTRNTFAGSSTAYTVTTPSYRHSPEDLVVIGSSTVPPSVGEGNSHLQFARQANPGLVDILKENGLFATAKYLRQSGLDTILNETGPYTIFAPTDKAFRTLLVQLGGPDRAEEKFRDNPRLLSGLLLHHVIPGAFDIASLQDEMTGVSLAGTQLRVNQYDMHDVEWNEVRVTTINGARVLEDKKDIHIPQGIAHAIDRVMFPLPVGDLVQTLQADRDRRFTTFLKAVQAMFAPTDAAFARMSPTELARYSDKAAARALVARHVLPGTLYSAGMRYGEYLELCSHLHKYIKQTDNILITGCGNSGLSADLYDVGFSNITNIDVSEVAIKQMKNVNAQRTKMKFICMDALNTSFQNDEFNVVLDKGTLDALMPDDTKETNDTIDKYFSEIKRVLKLGGRFVCISLLQVHILNKLLATFCDKSWMFRVVRCHEAEEKNAENGDGTTLPVFIVIATKFKEMPVLIAEVCMAGDKMIRLKSADEVRDSVKSVQDTAFVTNGLTKTSLEGEDEKQSQAINKESEWLFGTPAGRRQLQGSARFGRLVVAVLRRGHDFASLDAVKEELAQAAKMLLPNGFSGQIPFLSLGSDVGRRVTVHAGSSKVSGDFVVEDVDVEGATHRRLNKTKLVVDFGHISLYHSFMCVGAHLAPSKMAVLGLGGGGLCMFLKKCYGTPLTAVELDPTMLDIARDHFELTLDDSLKVEIKDGIAEVCMAGDKMIRLKSADEVARQCQIAILVKLQN